jgi:hypothetical protein
MGTLFEDSKEVGLEIKWRKLPYAAASLPECRSNMEHKTANRSLENVSQFKDLAIAVINEISFRRYSRGDCILVMLTTIQSTTFCLFVCCQNM